MLTHKEQAVNTVQRFPDEKMSYVVDLLNLRNNKLLKTQMHTKRVARLRFGNNSILSVLLLYYLMEVGGTGND